MKKQLRPAIAMIELIFAIVVMGITLLSAPLILNMSIESSNTAMQQESIAAAASELSLILTHSWNEEDLNNTGFGIMNVTAEDPELAPANRLVHSNAAFTQRRYNVVPAIVNASLPNTFGNTGDALSDNDIDDFNGVSRTVRLYNATYETSKLKDNEGEYLKGNNFRLNTTVKYGRDTAKYGDEGFEFNQPFTSAVANTTTNIKLITVTLTNTDNAAGVTEHSQSVTLRAFACNIGNTISAAAVVPMN